MPKASRKAIFCVDGFHAMADVFRRYTDKSSKDEVLVV
jgi:hypothetical protein